MTDWMGVGVLGVVGRATRVGSTSGGERSRNVNRRKWGRDGCKIPKHWIRSCCLKENRKQDKQTEVTFGLDEQVQAARDGDVNSHY